MKKIQFLFVLVCLSLTWAKTLNIAVLSLDSLGGVTQSESRVLSENLRSKLAQNSAWRLVERDAMEQILTEQGFQQTGCTSSECVVQAGRLLGVDQMVAGSVGRVGKLYVLQVRRINVETGAIVATQEVKVGGEIENVLLLAIPAVSQLLMGDTLSVEQKEQLQASVGRNPAPIENPAVENSMWTFYPKWRVKSDLLSYVVKLGSQPRRYLLKNDQDLFYSARATVERGVWTWFGVQASAYRTYAEKSYGANIDGVYEQVPYVESYGYLGVGVTFHNLFSVSGWNLDVESLLWRVGSSANDEALVARMGYRYQRESLFVDVGIQYWEFGSMTSYNYVAPSLELGYEF